MIARRDWIAVGPHGVYALLDADLSTESEIADFKACATERGHTVELVSVDEACRRHGEFLALCDHGRTTAGEARS